MKIHPIQSIQKDINEWLISTSNKKDNNFAEKLEVSRRRLRTFLRRQRQKLKCDEEIKKNRTALLSVIFKETKVQLRDLTEPVNEEQYRKALTRSFEIHNDDAKKILFVYAFRTSTFRKTKCMNVHCIYKEQDKYIDRDCLPYFNYYVNVLTNNLYCLDCWMNYQSDYNNYPIDTVYDLFKVEMDSVQKVEKKL